MFPFIRLKIQFWIEEEDISLPSGIRRTMRTHDIFMTSLEDEGNAWKEKLVKFTFFHTVSKQY